MRMLNRVQFEEWQAVITVAAFIICSLTFLYFCWRAIRMSKRDRQHLSNLPLESEQPEPPSHEQTRTPPER
jgi:cbb3-type cytochrome oxidase subunit 3